MWPYQSNVRTVNVNVHTVNVNVRTVNVNARTLEMAQSKPHLKQL